MALLPMFSKGLIPREIETDAEEIEDTEEAVLVHASLPGVPPENIEVTVEGMELTIKAAWSHRGGTDRFERKYDLYDGIQIDAITSSTRHGILTVRLPKERTPVRRIPVLQEASQTTPA